MFSINLIYDTYCKCTIRYEFFAIEVLKIRYEFLAIKNLCDHVGCYLVVYLKNFLISLKYLFKILNKNKALKSKEKFGKHFMTYMYFFGFTFMILRCS